MDERLPRAARLPRFLGRGGSRAVASARRFLVTGAGGFVGANLVRRLVDDGHDVLATHRSGGPWRLDSLGGFAASELDVRDREAVSRLFRRARPECILHLAAHGAYSWQTDRRAMVETNVLGTANVLEAALEAGVASVVHAGSSSEYGLKDAPAAESDRLEPNSDYAVTKAAATHYCGYLAQHGAASVVTLRLYSVFGPYEDPDRLMPTLVVAALAGSLPPLVNPRVARDFVHVDDVIAAFLLAAERPPEGEAAVYNVGTGTQTTIGELVERAREVFGVDAEPRWGSMPDRAWDTQTWVADSSKIRAELGWTPVVSLEDGLRGMADWLLSHPELWPRYRFSGGAPVHVPPAS